MNIKTGNTTKIVKQCQVSSVIGDYIQKLDITLAKGLFFLGGGNKKTVQEGCQQANSTRNYVHTYENVFAGLGYGLRWQDRSPIFQIL